MVSHIFPEPIAPLLALLALRTDYTLRIRYFPPHIFAGYIDKEGRKGQLFLRREYRKKKAGYVIVPGERIHAQRREKGDRRSESERTIGIMRCYY